MKTFYRIFIKICLILQVSYVHGDETNSIQKVAEVLKNGQAPGLADFLSDKIHFSFQGDGSLGEFNSQSAVIHLKDPKSYMFAILFNTNLARKKTAVTDFQSCHDACLKGSMTFGKKSIRCEYGNFTWDIIFMQNKKNELRIRFFDIHQK